MSTSDLLALIGRIMIFTTLIPLVVLLKVYLFLAVREDWRAWRKRRRP